MILLKLSNFNRITILNCHYTVNANFKTCCFLYKKLDLDLIWCGHFDFNSNSKRVSEKCGFKYKFTKDEKLSLLDNKEVKTLYYNILKSEYINK